MNDESNGSEPAKPLPTASELVTRGYDLEEKIVRAHGIYDLGYLAEDPEVGWAAGLTSQAAYDDPRHEQLTAYLAEHPVGYMEADRDKAPIFWRYSGTSEQWAELRERFSWVSKLFSDRIDPASYLFEAMIEELEQSRRQLYDVDNDIDPGFPHRKGANLAIDGWTGDTADAFKENAWYELPLIARQQAAFIDGAVHALHAEAEIWRRMRGDLFELGRLAGDAVEAATNPDSGGDKGGFLTILAGVATIAAGALGMAAGGGVVIAAGIATLVSGTATALGAEGEPLGEEEEVPLLDDTVSGIAFNLASAVSRLDQMANQAESAVADTLRQHLARLADDSTLETWAGTSEEEEDVPEHLRSAPSGLRTPRQKLVYPRPGERGGS